MSIFKKLQEKALGWSQDHPFWNRLFTEYGFRAIVFASGSFLINVAFAVYNGIVAYLIDSVWFGALAAYYLILIILRGSILLYHSHRRRALKKGQTEQTTFLCDTKVYCSCGILLVFLPLALSSAILQMVLANDSFVHTGITIYVYAIYAFCKIIVAIYNFIKTQKTHEMTVRAAKNISLTDAMVSILALQTAMFREFGTGMEEFDIGTMNAVTGAVVCALTLALGIFMIVNARLIFRKNKREN